MLSILFYHRTTRRRADDIVAALLNSTEHEMCVWFSLQRLPEISVIVRKVEPDNIIHLLKSFPAYTVRPCSENGRRKITQNSIEVDAETKESTRKTEEKLDGGYKEGHERKKPK